MERRRESKDRNSRLAGWIELDPRPMSEVLTAIPLRVLSESSGRER
jgi:hypothetical protein